MNLSNTSSGRNNGSMIWIIALGLAIVFGGLLIATLTPLILPTQGSAQAQHVDNLFRFMLAVGGMIFLLVEGLLLYSVISFRKRKGEVGDGPPIAGNTTLEFIWTIIPAIIVFVLAIYSYQVWIATRTVPDNAQVVEAVGARYAWSFRYFIPQEDLTDVDRATLNANVVEQIEGEGGIEFTSTQLHTFVNQPVDVQLYTEDVNHAFWVPAMRIKQDLLAGRITNVTFTPIEAGVYRIVCAELCGSGHGNMQGYVSDDGTLTGAWLIVHPDEETFLREFLRPERDAVLYPPEDPVALGRVILASGHYPCATCHILDDLGWVGQIGPNLNGIGDRADDRVPGLSAEEYLVQSIRAPGQYLVPGYGNLMPQFNDDPAEPNYMPDEDLNAIVAYLLAQGTENSGEAVAAADTTN